MNQSNFRTSSTSASNSPFELPLIPPCSQIITISHTNSSRPRVYTDGIVPYPQRRCLMTTVAVPDEPSSFTLASKFPEWCSAMTREFDAHVETHTWTLVPSSSASNMLVEGGSSRPSYVQMAQLSDGRCCSLLRVFINNTKWIIPRPSVRL